MHKGREGSAFSTKLTQRSLSKVVKGKTVLANHESLFYPGALVLPFPEVPSPIPPVRQNLLPHPRH